MSETKFTPGPWMVSDEVHGKGEGIVHIKAKYEEIAVSWRNAINGDYDEFLANAHLIAAAPDLYEALSLLLSQIDPWLAGYQEAEQALAKARGITNTPT